jgi:hypothetical protein
MAAPCSVSAFRTADFKEARRRLVDNLEWVVEVVQAADLEALGDILHHRLGVYVVGTENLIRVDEAMESPKLAE